MSGVPQLTAEEKLKLQKLSAAFKKNQHDIAVLDAPGMAAMWYGARLHEGASMEAAQRELQGKLSAWGLEDCWESLRDVAALAASNTANALDLALLGKLAQDLGRSGSYFTKYRISNYNGKAYVIFKGNHRARRILTGTRYLANNSKVVNMGVGKLGAAKAIAGGMKITIFLTIGFRAIDTLLREEATWHYFVGSVATDVVKVGISGGAGFLAASLVAGGAAVGTVAAGPLFAAIAVGIGVGLVLEYVDDRTGFTQSLIQGLRDAEAAMDAQIQEVKRQWRWYHRSPQSTVDFWMRVFGARY